MNGEISQLNERTILAQYGPMTLTIQAWDQHGPDIGLAARAGEYAFSILPRIAFARELFRGGSAPKWKAAQRPFEEPILEVMCRAVESIGQPGLGPMAAVAGAVADEVVRWLAQAGAIKAIVENGGDISLYLEPGQRCVVGIRTRLEDSIPSHSIELDGAKRRYWGVATSSGLGGRGLNRGLADAAACIAASGALADAAATAISNACTVESDAIKMVPAEQIDPATDIPGIMVTTDIGDLDVAEIDTALDSAARFSQSLVEKDAILGAYIFLRNRERQTEEFAEKIAPLVKL